MEKEQEYIKKLEEEDKKLKTELLYDGENFHSNYDEILCQFLEELGYKEIVKKYKEAREYFWYA